MENKNDINNTNSNQCKFPFEEKEEELKNFFKNIENINNISIIIKTISFKTKTFKKFKIMASIKMKNKILHHNNKELIFNHKILRHK